MSIIMMIGQIYFLCAISHIHEYILRMKVHEWSVKSTRTV